MSPLLKNPPAAQLFRCPYCRSLCHKLPKADVNRKPAQFPLSVINGCKSSERYNLRKIELQKIHNQPDYPTSNKRPNVEKVLGGPFPFKRRCKAVQNCQNREIFSKFQPEDDKSP